MREFGDFQTPPALVDAVLKAIYRDSIPWTRALEPTCGVGNFIVGLRSRPVPPMEIKGIEIQPRHVDELKVRESAQGLSDIVFIKGDVFQMNLAELRWSNSGRLLVVGNPPWVTNSELGSLGSRNLPSKSNFKGSEGFAAKTGDANFDIAEFIWIKLIKELAWAKPTIALLCKTSVARNVLSYCHRANLPISAPQIFLIDAKKWFGAAVDACLFRVDVGSEESDFSALTFSDLEAEFPQGRLGIANGALVSDQQTYDRLSFLDGESPVIWRQGLKHDAAAVMELTIESGTPKNRLGQVVDVEAEYLFPLLKSSDLNGSNNPIPRYRVVVTQKQLGEDTTRLRISAPKLFAYLCSHQAAFDARKSSIYVGRPPFSIFGIGDYSFKPYKVAVSGLYKTISFRVVGPSDCLPAMFDDTCYFVPCDSAVQAAAIATLLNHPNTLGFINSIVFSDSKRPVTKKMLQRVDLNAAMESFPRDELIGSFCENMRSLGEAPVTEDPFGELRWPNSVDEQQALFPLVEV